jgi:hypothetical protein
MPKRKAGAVHNGKGDASPERKAEPVTRSQHSKVHDAAGDSNQEMEEVAENNRLTEESRKVWCSHCGVSVTYETYTSSYSKHFGGRLGENWDLNSGAWKNTANGMPKRPLAGHDGLSIHTRLQELQHLDEPPTVHGVPSHLLVPRFMHGSHDQIMPGGPSYNDEPPSDGDSDSSSASAGGREDMLYPGYDSGTDMDDDGDEKKESVLAKTPPAPADPEDTDVSNETDPLYLLLRAWKSTSGTTDTDFSTLLKILHTMEKGLPKVARDVSTITLHTINTSLGLNKDLFDSICVCGVCGRLYERESCVKQVQNLVTRSRECCNRPLMKRKYPNSKDWSPVLTYPCVDVETALSKIVCREGVGELLDHWKTRSLPKGTYGDLYEGQVWEDTHAEILAEEILFTLYCIVLFTRLSREIAH